MASAQLPFFSPSANSFQSVSYPTASTSRSSSFQRNTLRAHDSLSVPQSMDPMPSDPNVVFVHPPFTTFPGSENHPDGLTYSLIAENPEWFLQAQDFASQHNTNPNAIPYPAFLEPPRGWCPAKKKDLKERGGDGWPEGEEPRLRCTFCRRTYAGVNAKSMWRRHVYEKHKIAMANRRDNNERPRGRGSGKENRHSSTNRPREEPHDSLVSMIVAPQTQLDTAAHKSRFRASKTSDTTRARRERDRKQELSAHANQDSQTSQSDHSAQSEDEGEDDLPSKIITPPSTPQASSSDLPAIAHETSDGATEPSPIISRTVIPESPYNPLQTPAFRHSPPRLPSDQPWKYPSPSHPFSHTREVSLTMLIRGCSPSVKLVSSAAPSPLSRLPSPSSSSKSHRYDLTETPLMAKRLFVKGQLTSPYLMGPPSSVSPMKRLRQVDNRMDSSPLGRSRSPSRSTRHQRQSSDLSDGWMTAPFPSTDLSLVEADPFHESWGAIGNPALSPAPRPKPPIIEGESPVLRSGPLPSASEISLTLMEAFEIAHEDPGDIPEQELREILRSPRRDKRSESKRVGEVLASVEKTPPAKKRRTSVEFE